MRSEIFKFRPVSNEKKREKLKTFIESRKRSVEILKHATWSEENEIAYNSQDFSFAFDCDVSPIDGYKKAHFLRDSV